MFQSRSHLGHSADSTSGIGEDLPHNWVQAHNVGNRVHHGDIFDAHPRSYISGGYSGDHDFGEAVRQRPHDLGTKGGSLRASK